jgi:uncharacterized membrane protein
VPGLLLCYFLPSLLNTFGIIDGSQSRLYYVASRFLLPACLVLLTLSIDLPAVARLGRKAVIMFFTGTAASSSAGRWRCFWSAPSARPPSAARARTPCGAA